MLSRQTSASFSRAVRDRGEAYFRVGKVKLADRSLQTFGVRVQGSLPYSVRLERQKIRDKVVLAAHCTCPYFEQGDLCKHIWAGILKADEEHWPVDAKVGRGPVRVDWGGEETGPSDVIYEEDEDYDDDDAPVAPSARRREPSRAAHTRAAPAREEPFDWQHLLRNIGKQDSHNLDQFRSARQAARPGRPKELWYGVHYGDAKERGELILQLFQREQRANGTWGPSKAVRLTRAEARAYENSSDRVILGLLFGAGLPQVLPSYRSYSPGADHSGVFEVPPALYDVVLNKLAETGRCAAVEVASSQPNDSPLHFVDGAPWRFEFALQPDPTSPKDWLLDGRLRRDQDALPLSAPKALVPGGLVLFADEVARLVPLTDDERQWVRELRERGAAQILAKDLGAFVAATAAAQAFPRLDWPEGTGWQTQTGVPKPKLLILSKAPGRSFVTLAANVGFDYGGHSVLWHDSVKRWVDQDQQLVVERDVAGEEHLVAQLYALHADVAELAAGDEAHVAFPATVLGELTERLSAAGWLVEAEGHRLQSAGKFDLNVSSGIDWFDLDAGCEFGQEKIGLPVLLAALKRGERYIKLGRGDLGILPEVWLQQVAAIAEHGAVHKSSVRFARNQAAILDALLGDLPEAGLDRDFRALRDEIRSFKGILPLDPPAGFAGSLRAYQREGLGWLHFLNKFKFGGCLADDMGLGKTVQVLALLQARARSSGRKRPSLIVVPRSLVANWLDEAARFCPELKTLDYARFDRQKSSAALADYDVVVTTYGVMRLDIERLAAFPFDYAILDEAQAIKNETAGVSKAARLLQAEHKLALTGTPVENHLGELGSIFAFLNPGMLKPALLAGVSKSSPEKGRRSAGLLAKALRPFILRRTKAQVLQDLPAKTEQTVYCEMAPAQRKLYEDLRRHYQLHLTEAAAKQGMARVKIQVLEALLRLRQAACHPGLINPAAVQEPSAKLEALLEHLESVIQGGHKALVFSQFTSMLALVRHQLDQRGIRYEYLDGQTRDRQTCVEAFQTNPAIPIFLISLKAGGVGLNLTAADYCFILDPWWNPAAEAQAIDRAHRIGQTKQVFAYRLIAKGTVEEKILALQEKKSNLASAIISADSSVLRSLSLDDLRLLFAAEGAAK